MKNSLILGDCLEIMPQIADKSVDMICTDLPYQVTNLSWDTLIPFAPLWAQYERIIKDNGAIILTGTQPFTSQLICSNLKLFKYEIIWIKHQATNPMFAKKGILKAHENICVFYKNSPAYNPQLEYDEPYGGFKSRLGKKIGEVYGENLKSQHRDNPDGARYPVSFVYFANPNKGKIHPTEKPVALLEYLIKTFSNPNDLVLDSCGGSGSLAIAALNTNRNFIAIEKNEEIYEKARNRISKWS